MRSEKVLSAIALLLGAIAIGAQAGSKESEPDAIGFRKPSVSVVHVDGSSSEEDVYYSRPSKKKCPKYQAFYDCLPSCPITCATVNTRKCRSAKKSYCRSGCDCAKGYARRHRDSECVRVSKCPEYNNYSHNYYPPSFDRYRCRKNEEYTSCGNSCLENCAASTTLCNTGCHSGCFCRRGYKRINGQCVDDRWCQTTTTTTTTCTGSNEIFTKGHKCHEMCIKPADCGFAVEVETCMCRPGFKRWRGICVDDSICIAEATSTPTPTTATPVVTNPPVTNTSCPANEELRTQPSCMDECVFTQRCQITPAPTAPICACSAGFKRIGTTCTPQSQCGCGLNGSLRANSNPCINERCDATTCGTANSGSYCWCNAGFVWNGSDCIACTNVASEEEAR